MEITIVLGATFVVRHHCLNRKILELPAKFRIARPCPIRIAILPSIPIPTAFLQPRAIPLELQLIAINWNCN